MTLDGADVAGKVVVVTGAARGIGAAIVDGLLSAGARVAGLDRSWDAPQEDMEGCCPLRLTADVTDELQLRQACEAVLKEFGNVHAIVNNAGYRQRDVTRSTITEVLTVPMAEWTKMIEVNVLGPLRVIKAFFPSLVENHGGAVVNVSSSSGVFGELGNQPYGASKAAFTNWSQSLASEVRELGIAVNIVFPAATKTTGYEDVATGSRYRGSFWRPESVVPLVSFLVTRDVSVTGRTFDVRQWNLEHGLGGDEVWSVEVHDALPVA